MMPAKFTTVSAVVFTFLATLLFITAFPIPHPQDEASIETFVDHALKKWYSEYGAEKGLKVARVDVCFRANPKNFVSGEGAVIAPIGQELPEGQRIIATTVYPPKVRELIVDGIKNVAWKYPGKYRTDLHYVALSLVKQSQSGLDTKTDQPTFKKLPNYLISDALATAKELHEHSLHECSAFPEWSKEMAGSGNYLEQFKKIVTKISSMIMPPDQEKNDKSKDDICAAMRKNNFTQHRAHVLAVMACRQNNIPCFGFISASETKNYLIGTYSDQTGWLYFDFSAPKKGFFRDPPVLLTRAPLIANFSGCNHNYWSAKASAYQSTQWGIYGFSRTNWGIKNKDSDYTVARTYKLDEITK